MGKAFVAKLAADGARDPEALAAWIGRKKHGKAAFQKLAKAKTSKPSGGGGSKFAARRSEIDREFADRPGADDSEREFNANRRKLLHHLNDRDEAGQTHATELTPAEASTLKKSTQTLTRLPRDLVERDAAKGPGDTRRTVLQHRAAQDALKILDRRAKAKAARDAKNGK